MSTASDVIETLFIGAAVALIIGAVMNNGNGNSVSDATGDSLDLTPSPTTDSLPTPSTGDPLTVWAQAIADFEGGGNPDSVSARNNNPGNLKFAGQAGAIGQDPSGFAIFDSFDSGWSALLRQLQLYVNRFPNFSITQITTHYLGGDPNNPQVTSQGNPFTYAESIAAALGVSTSATLKNTFGG